MDIDLTELILRKKVFDVADKLHMRYIIENKDYNEIIDFFQDYFFSGRKLNDIHFKNKKQFETILQDELGVMYSYITDEIFYDIYQLVKDYKDYELKKNK